jgi:hypothetical protein
MRRLCVRSLQPGGRWQVETGKNKELGRRLKVLGRNREMRREVVVCCSRSGRSFKLWKAVPETKVMHAMD